MGIFSFIKSKTKGELVFSFEVGSSSVGGVVFTMGENGVPNILFTTREPILLETTIDVDRFLDTTIKSLDVVVEKIFKQNLGAPSRIFCSLSSPWHVSQTRVIKLDKNEPFIFDKKLADSLVEKEIASFEEEYVTKYANTKSQVRSIEFKNIKTMLNGYEVSEPLNQKVKDIEMAVFISISPEQVLSKIEESIRKHFTFKAIKFSSFMIASFTVVRDMYIQNEDFLLIDVGGEVTDVSMIKKHILRESISFPLGINFIVREVAKALGTNITEAKSLVSLIKDGHASDEASKKIDPVLDGLRLQWLNKFQESLANISNDISIPSVIYITIDKELSDFFCYAIKTEQFNQYSFTESKFQTTLLSAESLHGLATFAPNAVRDTGFIINSVYINRFLK